MSSYQTSRLCIEMPPVSKHDNSRGTKSACEHEGILTIRNSEVENAQPCDSKKRTKAHTAHVH